MQTAKSKTYRVSLVHINYINHRILNWVDTMIEWYIPKSGDINMGNDTNAPEEKVKCAWCGKEEATLKMSDDESCCAEGECIKEYANSRGLTGPKKIHKEYE